MRNLKDKKITIYRKSRIKDSAGFGTTTYKAIHAGRLWAYVRQLSAGEVYAAKTVQQKEEMLFTINWRNDINAADCAIEYRGVIYDITRIDTFEGYKEDLKIYAAITGTQLKQGDFEEWEG